VFHEPDSGRESHPATDRGRHPQHAESNNPWHAWLTPVTTAREWVVDMVRLGDVKARGRGPFSLYLDDNGTRRCLLGREQPALVHLLESLADPPPWPEVALLDIAL
jgi:hypothetical protein